MTTLSLLLASSAILVGKDASTTGEAKPDANGIVEFVRYGTADPRCEGDLYLPKKVTDETPVALLIHGGGWTKMDRYAVAGIAEWLQKDLGFAVYNADYRLASKTHPWPACGEDCVAAARFVLDGGLARWGVKPKRILVIGGSAGGHLTLWTALSLKPAEVAGAVVISGIGDPWPDCRMNPKRYEGLFAAKPTETLFDSMDTRKLIRPGGPAILMTHAKEDTVVPIDSSRAFESAYRAAGNPVEYVTYSEKDEPNEGGHCIWRPASAPHRLLAHLEETIARWLRNRGILPGKPSVTTLWQPDADEGTMTPFRVLRPVPAHLQDARREFQAAPSVTVTRGGRLWAAWHTGGVTESEDNALVVATSGDGGRTWTKPLWAIDPEGPRRVLDPGLWTDPDGKVWLFYAQVYGIWDGRAGVWAMHPLDPEDPDTDWTEPRRLCDGFLKNKPAVLGDGTWLLPCEFMNYDLWAGDLTTKDRPFPPEHAHLMPEFRAANVFASADRGKTVSFRGRAAIPPKERDATENMVVERRDGSLWMLVRTTYGLGETTSRDGGRTWSPLVPSKIANPSARFFLGRLRSGALLLVKNGPVDRRTSRTAITAFVSDDDGATWKGGLLLDGREPVSYPDAVEDAKGFIHVVHDCGRTVEREIMHHRFTEADVRVGKTVSAGSCLGTVLNKAGVAEKEEGTGNKK